MAGGKVLTVIELPGRRLCCYGGPPFIAWAVMIYKQNKDGDWQCVENGKLPKALERWNELNAANGS